MRALCTGVRGIRRSCGAYVVYTLLIITLATNLAVQTASLYLRSEMSSNIWVITALGSWGLWGIFEKKALGFGNNRDVITILYMLHLLQIPVYLACLFIYCPQWTISFEAAAWSGIASALYAVALLSYLRALSKTDASYVLGSTACYPVISFMLAILFLGEKLILTRLLGAVVVAAGVFAMTYNFGG